MKINQFDYIVYVRIILQVHRVTRSLSGKKIQTLSEKKKKSLGFQVPLYYKVIYVQQVVYFCL